VNSAAGCNDNDSLSLLQHAVTLGIYCGLLTNPFYIYNDLYLECGNYTDSFAITYDIYGFVGERYTCSTSAAFPNGSSSDVLYIPDVSIVTDDNWLSAFDQDCYTISKTTSSPSTLAAVVPAPVVSSYLFSPTHNRSVHPVNPTIAPRISPVQPTFLEPSATPVQPTFVEPSATNDVPIGLVVGASLGGLGLIFLLALGFRKYQTKHKAARSGRGQSITSSHASEVADMISCSVSGGTTDDLDDKNHPIENLRRNHVVVAPPRPNYAVKYKDQASTVNVQLPQQVHDPADLATATDHSHKNSGINPVLVAPPQPHYALNYKDQAQTVIEHLPPPQQQVHDATTDALPLVAARDVRTAAKKARTRKGPKAEPPGRQFLEL
jgi:hypothetical protein